MPAQIEWKEIDKIFHNVKYTLNAIWKAEKFLKTAREELQKQMEEMEKIILEQPERQGENKHDPKKS